MNETLKRPMSFGCAVKLARSLVTGGQPPKPPALLKDDEVSEVEAALPYRSAIPMEERLMDGDLCYAVRDGGGEVQAFVWAASGRELYVYELDRYVRVPKDAVYLYDAYTLPSRRARGLMTELLRGATPMLGWGFPGAQRCEVWTSARNHSALRTFQRAGFEVYGFYRWLALGPARLERGSPDLGGDGV